MELTQEIKQLIDRRQGKKIVFTNGCFDLLHIGHVTYLNQAKMLGDILIVGLNSDSSIKRIKSDKDVPRPIVSEQERKMILENLKAVDGVQIFSEETPLELIKAIKPDVLVKGGDWPIEKMVGAKEVIANGGKVLNLTFVDGHSTTDIIAKILAHRKL